MKVEPADQSPSIAMSAVVKDALTDHYGKLYLAAKAMGMDPATLTRELQTGAFRFDRMEALDEAGKAAVAVALHRAFGRPEDPTTHAIRALAAIEENVRLLKQYVVFKE